MSRRHVWEMVMDRFDPKATPTEPSWRADRERSPAKAIFRALDRSRGVPHVLLTGTIGTGKTTELIRIAEARADKEFVVFLDLQRHFHDTVGDPAALKKISAWEVCFLAAMALLRAAEDRLGFQFPETHKRDLAQAWIALAKATGQAPAQPAIDVPALARSMTMLASRAAPGALGGPVGAGVGTVLHALAEIGAAGKWTLPIGLTRTALPDQDQQIQTLLGCVNVVIGLVQQRGSRVLLVIDGLDRLDEEDFERAKVLFLDSRLIGGLDCRLIVCGPFALRHHPAAAALPHEFTMVTPLVNEPVLLQSDPSKPGLGVDFFVDLFQRRVADLAVPDLVADPLLRKLAYYSGGRAREFVIFIRILAELAWDSDAYAATDALVAELLDERRRHREQGIDTGHIALLKGVMNDPAHELPRDPLAREVLRWGMLLPYPNESEWYYPHPLLTIKKLR